MHMWAHATGASRTPAPPDDWVAHIPEGADHDTWGVQYKLTFRVTAVFI